MPQITTPSKRPSSAKKKSKSLKGHTKLAKFSHVTDNASHSEEQPAQSPSGKNFSSFSMASYFRSWIPCPYCR
jgi:hypothetical protein